jgi:5-formyltetrahydrofolate cyclo-ligase
MALLSHLKKKLRQKAHIALRQQAEADNPEAAGQLRQLFLSHFSTLPPGTVISGTMPIKREMDPRPLMQSLEEKGHALCLPVMVKLASPLVFRAYRTGDELVPGVWGIGQPGEDKKTLRPDVLLCPLLAFDRNCRRLGYGGGYYDATLRDLRAKKRIIAVGLCYAAQEVEEIPTGEMDEPLDVVVTEKEIILPARV